MTMEDCDLCALADALRGLPGFEALSIGALVTNVLEIGGDELELADRIRLANKLGLRENRCAEFLKALRSALASVPDKTAVTVPSDTPGSGASGSSGINHPRGPPAGVNAPTCGRTAPAPAAQPPMAPPLTDQEYRQNCLDAADTYLEAIQGRMAGRFTKEALAASALRAQQKRMLTKLLHEAQIRPRCDQEVCMRTRRALLGAFRCARSSAPILFFFPTALQVG